MTNLEYLIYCLRDEPDDGGASFEAAVHYNIACPYFFDTDVAKMPCIGKDKSPSRKLCVECKTRWLESEVEQ